MLSDHTCEWESSFFIVTGINWETLTSINSQEVKFLDLLVEINLNQFVSGPLAKVTPRWILSCLMWINYLYLMEPNLIPIDAEKYTLLRTLGFDKSLPSVMSYSGVSLSSSSEIGLVLILSLVVFCPKLKYDLPASYEFLLKLCRQPNTFRNKDKNLIIAL